MIQFFRVFYLISILIWIKSNKNFGDSLLVRLFLAGLSLKIITLSHKCSVQRLEKPSGQGCCFRWLCCLYEWEYETTA